MTATALTTTDAFFVAYQERRGILMHFGAELELTGRVERAGLDAAIGAALGRWPALGQTLGRGLGGLRWHGAPRPVVVETADDGELERWRNTPIDPFREAPFGVLWIRRSPGAHVLALRCHHAVADGQLFFAIVCEVVGALAATRGGRDAGRDADRDADRDGGRDAGRDGGRDAAVGPHPLALRRLLRDARLGASWRHARWLAREARGGRSARIALRAVAPGSIASSDRRLDAGGRRAMMARAAAARVRPPWIAAAAWLQALHAWNRARGVDNPMFSVEVPVDLRRGAHAMTGTGNHLTVLTLFADARAPLDELARGLWRDYAGGIRRRDHLAVALLAQPARLLPWPVFRRVAVTSTSTGFATTHFTWLAREPDVRAEVRARSGGALALADQRLYTPVCLAMGAALCVIAWPDELQLAITHRLTGLSTDDASALGELVMARLR